MGRKPKDLTGQQFGDLTAIKIDPRPIGKSGHKKWVVRCKCSFEFLVDSNSLTLGRQTACKYCSNNNSSSFFGKYTSGELQQFQSLSLNSKINITKQRIKDWYEYWDGNVFVSFSGGKDSTVLLTLVRELYPNVPGVFCDTGLEFPDLRNYIQKFDNIDIIRPSMTFKQVCKDYGYPFFGKEIAKTVRGAKAYLSNIEEGKIKPKYQHDYNLLMGKIMRDGKLEGETLETRKSLYNKTSYKFMLDAPFNISEQCCGIMKKKPFNEYIKLTGRHPFIGTMASESTLRAQQWMKHGCNYYEGDKPKSQPMSIWTEQDVLMYIYMNSLVIAPPYGEVKTDSIIPEDLEIDKLGLFDINRPIFYTTGASRTGCMFCLFGAQLEGPKGRLSFLKENYPKQYNFIMKPESEGGLGYKDKIDWVNEHSETKIFY